MEAFKELFKELTRLLKEKGFIKKGSNFYMERNKNYGIINFQKSRDSTKDMIKFTINFGIYSDALGQVFDATYSNSKLPDVGLCQWEARIGQFMPNNLDHWWYLNPSDNISAITSDIMEIIQNIVISELNKHITDDSLVECWMDENNYSGTTEVGKFEYLTTLLKKKGDIDTLNQVVDTFMQKFKGRPNGFHALEHLKELGIT